MYLVISPAGGATRHDNWNEARAAWEAAETGATITRLDGAAVPGGGARRAAADQETEDWEARAVASVLAAVGGLGGAI